MHCALNFVCIKNVKSKLQFSFLDRFNKGTTEQQCSFKTMHCAFAFRSHSECENRQSSFNFWIVLRKERLNSNAFFKDICIVNILTIFLIFLSFLSFFSLFEIIETIAFCYLSYLLIHYTYSFY